VSAENTRDYYRQQGVEAERKRIINERERIIKLLEERTGYGDEEWDADVLAIIKIIKGENK
jgi:hypothetical protein